MVVEDGSSIVLLLQLDEAVLAAGGQVYDLDVVGFDVNLLDEVPDLEGKVLLGKSLLLLSAFSLYGYSEGAILLEARVLGAEASQLHHWLPFDPDQRGT